MSNRLAALERQHRELDREVEDALKHPSVDDLEITTLKRRKLAIKDEMYRLLRPKADAFAH